MKEHDANIVAYNAKIKEEEEFFLGKMAQQRKRILIEKFLLLK